MVARPEPDHVPMTTGMRRGDLLLLGVAAVWGSSYLAAQVLVVAGGVLAVLALRYLVSAVAMAVVCAARRPPRPGRRELAVGVGLGVTQAAVLALETYGVALTSATNAGLLISLTILLTPVLDGLVSRHWLPPRFFVAAGLALAGIALLISGSGLRTPSAGDALMLAAAVARAVHVTASGRLTRVRERDEAPMDTVTLTLLQMTVGAVIFSAAGGPAVARAVTGFGPAQWLGVLYLALGCSVFAFLVQLWAVRRSSASRASLLLGTEPLWAVLIGLCLAGDVLGPAGAAGAVLVVTGTFWGQRIETRHRGGRGPAEDRHAASRKQRRRPRHPGDLDRFVGAVDQEADVAADRELDPAAQLLGQLAAHAGPGQQLGQHRGDPGRAEARRDVCRRARARPPGG